MKYKFQQFRQRCMCVCVSPNATHNCQIINTFKCGVNGKQNHNKHHKYLYGLCYGSWRII